MTMMAWYYECEKARDTLHHWVKQPDGTAICKHCKIRLTVEETRECFEQK